MMSKMYTGNVIAELRKSGSWFSVVRSSQEQSGKVRFNF